MIIVTVMIYCKNCGVELEDNDQYCSLCGEPVNKDNDNQQRKKKGIKPPLFMMIKLIGKG